MYVTWLLWFLALNVRNYLPKDVVQHPRRLKSLSALLYEPQILHGFFALLLFKDVTQYRLVVTYILRQIIGPMFKV